LTALANFVNIEMGLRAIADLTSFTPERAAILIVNSGSTQLAASLMTTPERGVVSRL